MEVDVKAEKFEENAEALVEEDYVVDEYDVFLTKQLSKDLAVFQFPLRNVQRPLSVQKEVEEVRIKPTSHKVEMQLKINTDDNYDTESIENLGVTPANYRHALTSRSVPLQTNYAIGVFRGSKMKILFGTN
jgi:hypothetical protein